MIDFLQALPESLNQLSKRNESFSQVIINFAILNFSYQNPQIVQHLESEYTRTGVDKENVEKEAKAFVAKGLINILQDIELAAINLNQLVDLQGTTLDSLTSQVDVVQTRLSTLKSQHLLYGLDEMKHSSAQKTTTSGKSSTEQVASVQDAKEDFNRSGESLDAVGSSESKSSGTYKRIPLEQR